jgi:hypothetical protein
MRTGSSFRVNDLGASAALSAIDAGEAAAHKTKLAGVIAFYPSCRHDAAPSAPAPILIGDNDEWTPVSPCQALARTTNVEVVVYPGVAHAFAMAGQMRCSVIALSTTTRPPRTHKLAPRLSSTRTRNESAMPRFSNIREPTTQARRTKRGSRRQASCDARLASAVIEIVTMFVTPAERARMGASSRIVASVSSAYPWPRSCNQGTALRSSPRAAMGEANNGNSTQ